MEIRYWAISLEPSFPLEKVVLHDLVDMYSLNIRISMNPGVLPSHVDANHVSRVSATPPQRPRRNRPVLHTMQSSSSAGKRSFTPKDKQKLLENLDIEGTVITYNGS